MAMFSGANAIPILVEVSRSMLGLAHHAIEAGKETRAMELRYQAFRDALNAHRETAEHYLDQVFAERRFTLESFFDKLDTAVEQQDYQAMTLLIGGILAVLEKNPLHDFEKFKAALADPDTVLEL